MRVFQRPRDDESYPGGNCSDTGGITRGERRRRWTAEEKQAIAAQSLSPGASPSEVARLYGISTGQLYTWRRVLLAAQPELSKGGIGPFARVEVVAAQPSAPAPAVPSS